MVDYYQRYGLDRKKSGKELCDVLLKEKRKWILRQNAADLGKRQEAEQRTGEIEEAIRIFSDAAERKKYDGELARQYAEQTSRRTQQTAKNQQQWGAQQQAAQQQAAQKESDGQQKQMAEEQAVQDVERLYNTKNRNAVERACRTYFSKGYSRPELYFYLGAAYADDGEQTAAIETIRQGIQNYPDYEDFYTALGYIYLYNMQNPNMGETYVKKALQLDPSNQYAMAMDVYLMLLRGKEWEAEQKVKDFLSTSPLTKDYREGVSRAYMAYANLFVKKDPSGEHQYFDTESDYEKHCEYVRKAQDVLPDENVANYLEELDEYGKKILNPESKGGIIVFGIFTALMLVAGGGFFLVALLAEIALIYYNIQPKWQAEAMAITGERTMATKIARGLGLIVNVLLAILS